MVAVSVGVLRLFFLGCCCTMASRRNKGKGEAAGKGQGKGDAAAEEAAAKVAADAFYE